MTKGWVRDLVSSEFSRDCEDHRELKRNQFCLDCSRSLCNDCVAPLSPHSSLNHDERILRIYRNEGRDVVRLHEINQEDDLDCSLIKTYQSIKGLPQVYLNPRPEIRAKGPKSKGTQLCETCHTFINESTNRFCSIACKFDSAPRAVGDDDIKDNSEGQMDDDSRNSETTTTTEITSTSSEVIQAPPKRLSRKRKSTVPTRAPF